jgi:hypothetical protein
MIGKLTGRINSADSAAGEGTREIVSRRESPTINFFIGMRIGAIYVIEKEFGEDSPIRLF